MQRSRNSEPNASVHLVNGTRINHMSNHPGVYKRNISNQTSRIPHLFEGTLHRGNTDPYSSLRLGDTFEVTKCSLHHNCSSCVELKPNEMHPFVELSGVDKPFGRLTTSIPYTLDQAKIKASDGGHIPANLPPDMELNRYAKERAKLRHRKAVELEKKVWDDLQKELFNLFFHMKKATKNLVAEKPQEFKDLTDSEKEEIISDIQQFLKPNHFSKIKTEDINIDLQRNQKLRKYLEFRSNLLKDIVYEEVFFEERMDENKDDSVMQSLNKRLESKHIQNMRKTGGSKARQFIRFLLVKELMMKNERNMAVQKRLENELMNQEIDQEIREILLLDIRKEKPKKPVGVVVDQPQRAQSQNINNTLYSSVNLADSKSRIDESKLKERKKQLIKKQKLLGKKLKGYDLRNQYITEHLNNIDIVSKIGSKLKYKHN